MKAYIINMRPYIVKGTENKIRVDESGQPVLEADGVTPILGLEFPMKRNTVEVFMSTPATGRAVIKSMQLGVKIEELEGDDLYLDRLEYKLLVESFEKFAGFRPLIDGEMCQRIFEAEEVDIKPEGTN